MEQAFSKVTGMTVPMGQDFEQQFMTSYIPRITPWACNYSCGGADYPNLFVEWNMPKTSAAENLEGGKKESVAAYTRRSHAITRSPYTNVGYKTRNAGGRRLEVSTCCAESTLEVAGLTVGVHCV